MHRPTKTWVRRCAWIPAIISLVQFRCQIAGLVVFDQRTTAAVAEGGQVLLPQSTITNISFETSTGIFVSQPTLSPATTLDDNASTSAEALDSRTLCPPAITRARGIYAENHVNASHFKEVVLLTAANSDFHLILDNWSTITDAHGLKYAILALDDDLFTKMGPDVAVPSDPDQSVQHVGPFRKPKYNRLTCNKLRMISMVMQRCKIDVVFSDTDNVLLQDPFQRADFGGLIQSGEYDYLYSTNDAWTTSPNIHPCRRSGIMVDEGNTGFHYLNHRSDLLIRILEATVHKCDKKTNRLDDQTNFWKVMRRLNGNRSWRHCRYNNTEEKSIPAAVAAAANNNESISASAEERLSLCCLDPYYYSTGVTRPASNHSLVSFHANYNQGIEDKILKLKEWVDGGWKLPV